MIASLRHHGFGRRPASFEKAVQCLQFWLDIHGCSSGWIFTAAVLAGHSRLQFWLDIHGCSSGWTFTAGVWVVSCCNVDCAGPISADACSSLGRYQQTMFLAGLITADDVPRWADISRRCSSLGRYQQTHVPRWADISRRMFLAGPISADACSSLGRYQQTHVPRWADISHACSPLGVSLSEMRYLYRNAWLNKIISLLTIRHRDPRGNYRLETCPTEGAGVRRKRQTPCRSPHFTLASVATRPCLGPPPGNNGDQYPGYTPHAKLMTPRAALKYPGVSYRKTWRLGVYRAVQG
ncbi:hypothetical protein ACOMHN_052179 [Nucella lapillus]